MPLALLGNFTVHAIVLFTLYHSIRNIWIKQYENEYTKRLVEIMFYSHFSIVVFLV